MNAPSVPSRECVWLSIRHRQPPRLPYFFTFTTPARRKLEAYYQTTELEATLGNFLVKCRARPPDAFQQIRPDLWRDEFGVVWDRSIDKDIGVVVDYPLQTRSLERLALPDPHDPRRYEAWPAMIASNPDRFRLLSFTFSLWERAWTLRSMPELMIDMLEAPEWVDDLLDAIMTFNMGILEEALRYDIDGVMFGDDWGQQQGLLFGPALWGRFIKPRIARMYDAVKKTGRAVFIHCCGRVQELLPELIDLGLDVFNPFQPEVMDPYEMKRLYGDRLAFYGGLSVQRLLPYGTPRQIRDEVIRLMDKIGEGGGFIISSSHDLTGDIPLENMVALIETVREKSG